MPCPLLIFSQSDYLIQIIDINTYLMANSADIDQLAIWIYTVCKGRVYPGSAGQGLNFFEKKKLFQIIMCGALNFTNCNV